MPSKFSLLVLNLEGGTLVFKYWTHHIVQTSGQGGGVMLGIVNLWQIFYPIQKAKGRIFFRQLNFQYFGRQVVYCCEILVQKHTEETLWHFHLCAPQTDEMLKVPSHWQIITACCTNGAVDKSAGQRLNKNFRIWGLAAFSAHLWSLLKMTIWAYEKHSGVYFGRRLLTLCRPDLMLLIGDSKFACIPKLPFGLVSNDLTVK